MSVIDPHIRVAGVPDWRTTDALLASITSAEMTHEQRVLAVFNTVRRMFVHGPTPPEMAYDFHRVMHVLGTGACLSMTTPLQLLYEKLGYRSQSWVHDGHHMMQVEYGGAWHCLDPHMCFSCYDRSEPPQLASIEQLRADASLARDAVAEGRAGDGYLQCGDAPDWFAGNKGDWYLEAGGDWPQMRLDEPFGDITLRPGESYTRTWHPGEHFYRAGWLARDGCGPIHHCLEADRRDQINWPLFAPHGWLRPRNERTYFRAWGVGRLEYRPRFSDGSYRAGIVAEHNTAVTGDVLVVADREKPGTITFDVGCPYVLTACEFTMHLTGGDGVRMWLRVHDEHTVAPGEQDRQMPELAHEWTELQLQRQPDGCLTATADDEINGCFHGYEMRLQLVGDTAIQALHLVSHFQLNRYALPHLLPGHNAVHVAAEHFESPLTVRYEWAEGPAWQQARCAEHIISSDETIELDVTGPCYPRMQELTLAV
jgi:hypothetical protein